MGFFQDLKADLSQAVDELSELDITQSEKVTLTQENDVSENKEEIAEEEVIMEEENKAVEVPVVEESLNDILENLEESRVQSRFQETKNAGFKEVSNEVSTITKGMTISGDMETSGSIEIVGTIIGNVFAAGKLNVSGAIQGNSAAAEVFSDSAKITGNILSEGSVKVGPSSVIIGDITATSAVIAGAVKGDIDVQGPVILDSSAIVMGNIKSKSVQINNGAVIEGICSQCYAEVSPTSFFDVFNK